MLNVLTELHQRGQDGIAWLDRQTGGWFLLLLQSLRDVLSFKDSLYAAATAYFTLFSVFPLILLTVGIATFWFDPFLSEEAIFQRLEFVIPAVDDLLGANLEQIVSYRGTITRLSAVMLIWSASSMVYMLTRAMDAIWEQVTVRPAWRHRAIAIGLTLGISILLLLGSFAWSVAVPIINRLLPDRIVRVSPYFSVLGALLLSVSLFTLLYKMLPHATLKWRDVIVGAVLSGLLWELAKRAFLFFVTNYLTLSNLVYGSLTTIIAFLTWAYVSSLIFLFGAHVNVRYKYLRQDRRAKAVKL